MQNYYEVKISKLIYPHEIKKQKMIRDKLPIFLIVTYCMNTLVCAIETLNAHREFFHYSIKKLLFTNFSVFISNSIILL